MQSIFELTTPRAEVLQGDLHEDMFAARLRDVMERGADEVYQNPNRFFENTFPTAGLKTLLKEVLGRLTGQAPASNPFIRLETSFGGGKTHNLIALYHAVNGELDPDCLKPFTHESWRLPRPGEVDVAGVVGSDLDPSTGLHHPADNITTYTLWGELAYQLGGRAGYALAEEGDRNKAAPGTTLFERIIGDRPTLIMIDEIARHMRAAIAVPTATGKSNLADQTTAFLMSLIEFAASQKQVVLVLTMASDVDAFAQETAALRNALAESLKVSARQERVLTPTGENEIAAIVVHRLFRRVDRVAAQAVIKRYGAYYQELEARGAHVHDRALRADYLQEFAVSYPFHPELIRVLNLKVSTIPNFQRTRGALRLLAVAVRQLWANKLPNTWLIHPYHVDLSQQQIIEDLTSRLDRPKFKQVCEADIVSPQLGIPAHASEVDQPLLASGKPAYARQAGTTIFLHSLTQGIASGVELPELMLAVVTPTAADGDDPAAVARSLERLYETAWFLEYDGYRYRFKTEPSLNKIVDDETGAIGPLKAKQEIDNRIRNIWRKGFLQPEYFPAAPGDLDDDAGKPKLAILHYDAVQIDASTTEPPDLVRRLYEHAGALEAFRTYQNNVMFLVADVDQTEQMIKVARRYLAISRITGSADRMREFHKEHQKKLKEMGQAAELDVRVAITKAYRYLFYPTSDAPKSQAYLRRETVPPQDQGDTDVDQTNVVVRVLHNLRKVRTADDDPLPAQYLFAKAWDKNQVEMSTEDLRRAFARKIGLPLLLDVNQLKRTIESGVKAGVWVYYSAGEDFAYDHESPPALWQIGDTTYLYTPTEAARLNLHIKGKWQPPPADGGLEREDEEPPEDELEDVIGTTRPRQVKGFGVPSQAFQQLLDQCQEYEVIGLRRLQLAFQGIEQGRVTDLKAIGLSIPQIGKAEFGIRLKLITQFDEQTDRYLNLEFQGDWKRYKRLKQITDAFAGEASTMNVDFRLVVAFEMDLDPTAPELGIIRDVLVQMGMGTIQLEAEAVYDQGS
jgi:hypothetical protein